MLDNSKKSNKIKSQAYCLQFRKQIYLLKTKNKIIHSHNKCKGVKKCVVENNLDIDDYRETLHSRDNIKISQNNIRSYGHHSIELQR